MTRRDVPAANLTVVDAYVKENGGAARNANLGVSFSKTRYFSKDVMGRYVTWLADRFDHVLIVIADHPEAYNAQVFKGLPFDAAQRRCLEAGRQLREGYKKVIPASLSDRVRIELASDHLQTEACRALVDRLERLCRERHDFDDSVKISVREALSSKLAAVSGNGFDPERAIEVLASYLIEELAIVLYLSHLRPIPYPVMVVPHFIPTVLPKLYVAPYADLVADVIAGEPFQFMKLVTAAP